MPLLDLAWIFECYHPQASARGIPVSDNEEKEEEQSPSKDVKKENKACYKSMHLNYNTDALSKYLGPD